MIEVNGFVATDRTVNYAFWLLSKILKIDAILLKNAIPNNKGYKTRYKGGKGKKKRRLDIPPDNLKIIQELLLERLFYRIRMSLFTNWNTLTGYRQGKSNLDNITPHLNGGSFIQLDLADAFPSTNEEMVRKALSVLFNIPAVKGIFSQPKLRWFKNKFLIELNQPVKTDDYPDDPTEPPIDYETTPKNVLWAMREIILQLTMFENRLPQGAPTSPFLFNLVMVDCQMPGIVQRAVNSFFGLWKSENKFAITIYADNITISSKDLNLSARTTNDTISTIESQTLLKDLNLSAGVANNIITAIESQTSFRINLSKVHCTSIKSRSPNITGLSIGKRESTIVTVPRDFQRRTRGLLHLAIKKPDIRESAMGMVAYLTGVYGSTEALPRQIKSPYEILLAQIAKE